MTTRIKKDTEVQKRQRDIAGTVISAAVSLVTTFLYTKAIVATLSLALAVYFLVGLLFTFLKEGGLSNGTRLLCQIVLTTAIVTLAWHLYFRDQYHEQRAAVSEGDLTPEKATLQGTATVQIGNGGGSFLFGSSLLPPWAYRVGLQVREGASGVLLTTSIKDREGHLVVAVKDNHWTVYPPYCSDKNYTRNSLEVKDSSGEVVLQAVLIGSTVRLQGIWRDQFGGGVELLTDENGKTFSVIQWSNAAEERQKEEQISPIFLYPSSQYWGQKVLRLTVDDFELSRGITVVNSSSEPLVALSVTVATDPPTFSYSRDLNTEIGPHQTRRIKFPEFAASILPPTPGSFEDQWRAAMNTYKGCVSIDFFSQANQDFGYIKNSYRTAHLPRPYGDAVGVIKYKASGAQTVTTTSFPLEAFLTRIRDCQP
jgi:hypothetical protein